MDSFRFLETGWYLPHYATRFRSIKLKRSPCNSFAIRCTTQNLQVVERFLGTSGSGDTFEVPCEPVYTRMSRMLLPDFHEVFGDEGRASSNTDLFGTSVSNRS